MESVNFTMEFQPYWDKVSFDYDSAHICGCKKYTLFDSFLKAAPELITISYKECGVTVELNVDTSSFADARIFDLIVRVELIDYPLVPPAD